MIRQDEPAKFINAFRWPLPVSSIGERNMEKHSPNVPRYFVPNSVPSASNHCHHCSPLSQPRSPLLQKTTHAVFMFVCRYGGVSGQIKELHRRSWSAAIKVVKLHLLCLSGCQPSPPGGSREFGKRIWIPLLRSVLHNLVE
jgi:hypothetical protein